MIERPILFSKPMVRAILEGRKTVTRRVFKVCGQPITSPDEEILRFDDGTFHYLSTGALSGPYPCPYGDRGDHLWVRETWGVLYDHLVADPGEPTWYRATDEDRTLVGPTRWRPSIHMPRSRSRLTLEVTSVRVERLQDISEHDAAAEGFERANRLWWLTANDGPPFGTAGAAFRYLWEKINGLESWNANPLVWVVEFQRLVQAGDYPSISALANSNALSNASSIVSNDDMFTSSRCGKP